MGASPQMLSQQDLYDLIQVREVLKQKGDPRAAKVDALIQGQIGGMKPSPQQVPSLTSGEYQGPDIERGNRGTIAPGESTAHALTRQAAGGIGRATKGIAGFLNPIPDLKSTGEMLAATIPGGLQAYRGSKMQVESGMRAYELAKEGRYSEAAGHGLAAALPGAPIISGAVEQAEKGTIGPAAEVATFAALPTIQKGALRGGKYVLEANRLARMSGIIEKGLAKIGEGTGIPYSETAVKSASRVGTLAPQGAARESLLGARDLSTVKFDLAKIARDSPVKAKGAEGALERANNVVDYMDKLWEESHKKPIERQANTKIDVSALEKEISESISPEAISNAPAEATAAKQWIGRNFSDEHTVASADSLLREINADLKSPASSTAYGPLLFRTKQVAAHILRDGIDAALEKAGEIGVKDANRRWGALRTVAQQMTESAISEATKGGNTSLLEKGIHTYGYLNPKTLIPHGGMAVSPAKWFEKSPSGKVAEGMKLLVRSGIEPLRQPPAPPGGPPPPPVTPPGQPPITPNMTIEQLVALRERMAAERAAEKSPQPSPATPAPEGVPAPSQQVHPIEQARQQLAEINNFRRQLTSPKGGESLSPSKLKFVEDNGGIAGALKKLQAMKDEIAQGIKKEASPTKPLPKKAKGGETPPTTPTAGGAGPVAPPVAPQTPPAAPPISTPELPRTGVSKPTPEAAPASPVGAAPASESTLATQAGTHLGPVENVDPKSLTLDPQRMQFKTELSRLDRQSRLGSAPYDIKASEGPVTYWREPGTGKLIVVDGHFRTGKAIAAKTPTEAFEAREVFAPTLEGARAFGAYRNIASGHALPIDVAKFMRDTGKGPETFAKQGIPASAKLVDEGARLANLDDSIFNRVATGEISEKTGVVIGKIADKAKQIALWKLIEKQPGKLSQGTLESLARRAENSGSVQSESLFGKQTESNAIREAQVEDILRNRLSSDKRLFGFVSRGKRPSELARGGNVIDVNQSKGIAEGASQALDVFDRLVRYKGGVNDVIVEAAKSSDPAVISDAYVKVLKAIQEERAKP